MSQTVLITGAAGFIGSHLTEALLRHGYKVRAADRNPGKGNLTAVQDHPGLELHPVELADADTCSRLCAGADAVLHFAAMASVPEGNRRPDDCRRDTFETTRHIAQAAKAHGVKRVVFASTAAVYGDAPSPVAEDAARNPLNPYAQAKADAEQVLRESSLDAVCLRFFNVYGPRQDPASPYAGVITRFISAIRGGEPISLHGDGEQTRDFLHVLDAVRAAVLALQSPGPFNGDALNIGTGVPVTLNELLNLLRWLLRAEPDIRHEPAREGDIRHSCADVKLAEQRLGFRAGMQLENGLRGLIQEP
jgi:UDP-glucose 4-epimerase